MQTYGCENCLKTFPLVRTDDEAIQEFKDTFPAFQNQPTSVVCENCYILLMKKINKVH